MGVGGQGSGGGQNREGSKRQGDNWGTPWHEEYQVYFISSKGRSSAHAGGVKKRDVLISLRPYLSSGPGLPSASWAVSEGPRAQCPASRRLGCREPHPPRAGVPPPACLTALLGVLLGSRLGRSLHMAHARGMDSTVCALLGGRVWRCLKGDSVLWLGPGALLSTS